MQDPSWQDVFAYMLTKLEQQHSPLMWGWLLMPLVSIASLVIGLVWQRHVQHQRVAIVAAIFQRWSRGLDKPLDQMTDAERLVAIDRLGNDLLGHPATVLQFLLALRVVMETWQAHDSVLEALDQLTQVWHDKLPSDRKRRERRAQALARRDVARLVGRIEREADRDRRLSAP
jgi:hypothetical protein